jgi:hypothetical protein
VRAFLLARCFALGFSFFAVAASAQSQTVAGTPQYGIKEDMPRTGSHIRRDAVRPTNIAINRGYADLSPEERQRFLENYENLPAGDEPPFPVEGLRALLDPILKAQQKLLVKGDLFLIATIDAKGEVVEVKAIGSPSARMTKVAASIFYLTKFKPAVCGGSGCQMEFPLRLSFVVD